MPSSRTPPLLHARAAGAAHGPPSFRSPAAVPTDAPPGTLILLPPPPDLAPVTEYLWQLVLPGGAHLDAFWRVVADGYVDVALRLPLDPLLLDAAERSPASGAAQRTVLDALAASPLVVCGAARAARTLPLPTPMLLTGVRFRLGAASSVLRQSIAELVDGARPLRDVLDGPGELDVEGALVRGAAPATPAAPGGDAMPGEAFTAEIPVDPAAAWAAAALRVMKRTGVVALARRLVERAAAQPGGAREPDARVRDALRLLDRAPADAWAPSAAPDHGEARIAAIARSLAVSPRTLERLFAEHVGFAPRTYQRLRRVGAVTEALEQPEGRPNARRRTLSELAHMLGYTDHAHMTREFTRAMGVSPSAYRREALAAPVARRVGAVAFERSIPVGTIGRGLPAADAAEPAGAAG